MQPKNKLFKYFPRKQDTCIKTCIKSTLKNCEILSHMLVTPKAQKNTSLQLGSSVLRFSLSEVRKYSQLYNFQHFSRVYNISKIPNIFGKIVHSKPQIVTQFCNSIPSKFFLGFPSFQHDSIPSTKQDFFRKIFLVLSKSVNDIFESMLNPTKNTRCIFCIFSVLIKIKKVVDQYTFKIQ